MSKQEVVASKIHMSSKQKNRLESKKRKVKAFLELVSKDSGYLNYREKRLKRFKNGCYNTKDDPSCSLSSFRSAVRDYKKYKGPPPSLDLLDAGIKAQVVCTPIIVESELSTVPLYVGDIQQFLLKAVLNMGSPCRPRWCSLHQSNAINNVVLFIVEGLSKDAIVKSNSVFPSGINVSQSMVEVITPYSYSSTFASELCEVSIFCYEVNMNLGVKNLKMLPCNSHKPLSSIVPVMEMDQMSYNVRASDEGFSRLHLLLSPIQMVMENFPLPQSVFKCLSTKGYKMTKNVYSPVTSRSAMFAIDCEMCRVVSGRMEVTRVAIVDEKLNTIYSTLVKPNEKIVDYVTKYSGITEKMLRPVNTTLEDVQNKIKELLPPDAILCGQSLNFDLHALRIIHPYIIDTSVIYNTSGCRTRKTGLKVLSSTFLKEKIQNSEKGHHPVEDCIAAMKLIQLKLQSGPQFGDSILSTKIPLQIEHESRENDTSNDSPVHNSKSDTVITSFFAQFPAERKSSLLIVHDDFSDQYAEQMLNAAVRKESQSSNKKVLKHTLQHMSDYNLTISHFSFPSCSDSLESSLSKIDKWVEILYKACPDNSAFIFVGTGKKNEGRCENGFCQVKIKD